VRSSFAVDSISGALAVVGPLGALLAIAAGAVALVGASVGPALLAPRSSATATLYLCVAAAAALPLLLLTHRGESQLYWVQLGVLAIAALGGVGVERVVRRRALAFVALPWLALLLALAFTTERDAFLIRYGGAAAVAIAVLGVVAARRSTRPLLADACVVMLLGAAAVNLPLDTIAPLAGAQRSGVALSRGDDVTPELHRGLVWLRDNTPSDAVLATDRLDTAHGRADNFVVSALAERRVFLEGWRYSIVTLEGDRRDLATWEPFADRRRLNDAAFRGDARALRTLSSRHGVDYLIVHRESAALERALGEVVFANDAVAIFAARP
jgi:hypothetical protein